MLKYVSPKSCVLQMYEKKGNFSEFVFVVRPFLWQ